MGEEAGHQHAKAGREHAECTIPACIAVHEPGRGGGEYRGLDCVQHRSPLESIRMASGSLSAAVHAVISTWPATGAGPRALPGRQYKSLRWTVFSTHGNRSGFVTFEQRCRHEIGPRVNRGGFAGTTHLRRRRARALRAISGRRTSRSVTNRIRRGEDGRSTIPGWPDPGWVHRPCHREVTRRGG